MPNYARRVLTPTRQAQMIVELQQFEPKNEIEKRDLKICKYFLENGLNAMAISRLNDPDIVCMSNRNKGRPLSGAHISVILKMRLGEEIGYPKRTLTFDEMLRIAHTIKKKKHPTSHIKQCAFCGEKKKLEEHHMIPLSFGGTNDDMNLVYLCHSCHSQVTQYHKHVLRSRESYTTAGGDAR